MKSPLCSGCILSKVNQSFVPPDGDRNAPLLVVGEAAGIEEARAGKGFVGPSGQFLWSWARRAGFKREDCRVSNLVWCRPSPDAIREDIPPPQEAVNHCVIHREPVLDEPHRAILTLGVPATRAVMQHFGQRYEGSMDNWHGYVVGDGSAPYIIPSYHPSFIMQHSRRHTGIFRYDIGKAWEVASQGFKRSQVDLITDPDPNWFAGWAEEVTEDTWLSVDIETPPGGDIEDVSGLILYVNFAYNTEQGVSVPFQGSYIPIIGRLLQQCRWQWYWHKRFDFPRLARAFGWLPGTESYNRFYASCYDAKDAWHILQSDMGGDDKDERDHSGKTMVKGNSLGFVAPLYSNLPPWKHLPSTDPTYRAMDGVQTLRVAYGIAADLQRQGQWQTFLRHSHERDVICLRPASDIGLLIDQEELKRFGEAVEKRQAEVTLELQALFPSECLPLSPPRKTPFEGLEASETSSWPQDGSWVQLGAGSEAGSRWGRLEAILVRVCDVCGAYPVASSHNCLSKKSKK